MLAASAISTGVSLSLVNVHSKIAAGRALSWTFSGMNGFQAFREARTGTSASDNFTVATGYSPVNDTSRKRGRPASLSGSSPPASRKGGWSRPSSTRATGGCPAAFAHSAKNVQAICRPLAGWFCISKSRRLPHPPKLIVPVPIPPSGKAISERFAPEKLRCGPTGKCLFKRGRFPVRLQNADGVLRYGRIDCDDGHVFR